MTQITAGREDFLLKTINGYNLLLETLRDRWDLSTKIPTARQTKIAHNHILC